MAVTLAPLTDYPFDTVTRRTDEQQFGVEILMRSISETILATVVSVSSCGDTLLYMGAGRLCFALVSERTFTHSLTEKVFCGIFCVFRVDINVRIMR